MATAAVAPSQHLSSAISASSLATPPSYASLAFPLPEKRYVGMLRCQIDPLAQTLVTTVARCDKVVPAAKTGGGKKAKGALSEVDAPPAEEWEVELFDTVLFPEGGGQPSDTGRLVPLVDGEIQDGAAGEPTVVRQVIRRNLDAVHFVSRPLEIGAKVRVEVDWQRRRDHQDQHTGQHLLSAVLEHECHLDTLSWSLQKFPELSYIELPRAPTTEEIAAVQERCNDLIGEARPIRVNFELATKETGVELGEKVPANYKSDESGEARPPVQRTVIIEGVDTNPCCGTHYPSLAYLRTLYLSPFTTSIRGTNARVYFACGAPRVLAHLEGLQLAAREAALAAGCAVQDLPKKVEGLVGGVTESKRREKKLAGELAGWVASDLWDRAQKAAAAETEDKVAETEDKVVKALCFREDDATNSLEFLTAIAGELKPRIDALPQGTKHLIMLACGATAGSPGAAAAGGAVLIVGSDDLVLATGKKVVDTFGKDRVKGGGKGRWQGKMTGRWENGDEILLKRAVEAVA